MGIISAFVILVIDVLLWLLPIQSAITSFRTDQLTNTFTVSASVTGNATAILSKELFNGNTALASVTSNITSDTPVVGGYTDATRRLVVTSLTPSISHVLTVVYSTDAFPNQAVWTALADWAPYLFMLVLIILPILAVVLFVLELRRRHS